MKLIRAALVAASVVVAVAGCVDKTTYLTRNVGGQEEITRCEAKAYGLVFVVMEEDSYSTCMEYYRQHGYVQQ